MKDITVENFSYSNIKEWLSGYSHEDKVRFAIYSAELVVDLYTSSSDAPKKAIRAAKDWLLNPSEDNKKKCKAASDAAAAAAYATADAAAYAAAYAADAAAAYAADAAAAYAGAAYAAYAADAADAAAARKSIKGKLIDWLKNPPATLDVMAQDNEAEEAKAVAKYKPFLQTGEPYEHTKTLNFILGRMVEIHGEKLNYDYMHKLKNAIAFVERCEDHSGGEPEKPQPRMKVEYVKVAESIFDLKHDLKRGRLYYEDFDNEYHSIDGEMQLVNCFDSCCVHRKVERPIEWWEVINEEFGNVGVDIKSDGLFTMKAKSSMISSNFFAMCKRVNELLEQEGE